MRNSAAGGDGTSPQRGIVIAVDGPSASGKSSASRRVARMLGLRYLDTGAMYRALTLWLLRRNVPVDDPAAVARYARDPVIGLGTDPDAPWVTLDGEDVSAAIRSREVSGAVSAVARVPQVRAHLIALQREIIARARAEARGIVAEGRDIGTVVAPDALVKVFLTASEAARARRRTADLAGDPAVTVAVTQADQARRDRMDAPQMRKADDAVEIDSTRFGLDEVVNLIADLACERAGLPGAARTARR
ncbi:MAG TPA: (d)CMP kinase [Streptosporangiaceae bacterium]|nr:(d)CMP kinase [Streptosporangiaceae bacterium]